MKARIKLNPAVCFIIIFAVSLFYFSYRYIFQWANESTSGTYSATPLIVQVCKYIIVMVLLIMAFVFSCVKYKGKTIRLNISFLLIFFAFASSVYAFLVVMDQNTFMIMLGMSVVFVMMISVHNDINLDSLDRLVVFFINVNILYEGVQLFLYFSRGRLPAIAWGNDGIMQVRFGGVFDDPFALSLFMGFIIPYVYHRFGGLKRWVYTMISIVMLIFTWTLTSSFSIIGVFVIYKLWQFLRKRKSTSLNLLIAMVLCLGGILFMARFGERFVNELLRVKAGSILVHSNTRSLEGLTVLTFLGLTPEAHYAEATPSRLVFTNGAIFTVVFYIVGVMSVKRFSSILKHLDNSIEKYRPLFLGMLVYQFSFLIGSFNLPFPYMFFNMMVFSLFAGIGFTMTPEKCLTSCKKD